MATTVQDFLKQNPRYVGVANTKNQTAPKKKIQGRGGTLSSLIAELGGTGGAVGGAATGAAVGSVVPGVGTLIGGLLGAGIGGFAGGSAGQAVENKVRDNQNFLGKGGSAKSSLQYGALTGALSAIPLGGVAKSVRGVASAGKAASTGATKTNIIKNTGQRLESRAGGYGQGTKLPNGTRLTNTRVQEMKQLDQAEKIPAGHPDKQGAVIESRLIDASKQLDDAVKAGNRRITAAEKKSLADGIAGDLKRNIAISNDPAAVKEVNQLLTGLKKVQTIKQAVQQKRNIQKEINFNRNSSSAVPGKEQANTIALRNLNKFINKSHPDIGVANKRWSSLNQRLELSGAESANLKNQSVQAGGGAIGRVMTGDTATAVKSRVGNILQKTPGGGTASPILSKGTLTKELAKQTIGRAGLGQGPQPQNALSQETDQPLDPNAGLDENGYALDPSQSIDQTGQPQATLQDALIQAQSLLGDRQTAATYLSYAKALMSGNKQTATQQKTAAALQNARNVVDELTQAYQQVGGPQGAGTGTARNLAGKVRLDQNARNYNDLRQAFLSRIARAFGEVGTLNEGDITRALGAIPDLADNQQTAARKLTILNSLLTQAEQNNSGGASADLMDALSQLQGGYQ